MLRLGENLPQRKTTLESCSLSGKTGFLLQLPVGRVQAVPFPRTAPAPAARHEVRPLSPREQQNAAGVERLCLVPLGAFRRYVNTDGIFLAAVKCTSAHAKPEQRPGEPSRRPVQEACRHARVAFLHEPGCQLELSACNCFVHPK